MNATKGEYDAWEMNMDAILKDDKDNLTKDEKIALQLYKGDVGRLIVHNNTDKGKETPKKRGRKPKQRNNDE